jgi:hypothetical protein
MSQNFSSLNEKDLQIIALFQQNMGAKEVATRLHFVDHRQMANYMKNRGYVWNSEKRNYEFKVETNSQSSNISNVEVSCGDSVTEVMTFLKAHKEVLMEIFSIHSPIPQMPRYVIPGVYTTKSVYMNHNFDQLARQFSEEKNISQRDIFEIALIDFFKKYGYHEKVKALISAAAPIVRTAAVLALCMML